MYWRIGVLGAVLGAAACGGGAPEDAVPATAEVAGQAYAVRESVVVATFDASGVAEPVQRAMLSTRLMGNVTAVLVQEGDRVGAGQMLARIDAREMDSKRTQVEAGVATAEAIYQDAVTQAGRFRALYADSAATRYQLEQVETGLVRAEAGLRSARAAQAELEAVGSYTAVRAPFAGVVTRRMVDPGAFAAPGAPLLEIQDGSRLRVTVSVPPTVARGLRRGAALAAVIEGTPVRATVEGVIPAGAGSVSTLNALVENRRGEFLPGSAAVVRIPAGTRRSVLVPAGALITEGDLTGVRVKQGKAYMLRWVRTGSEFQVPSSERGPLGTRNAELGTPEAMIEILSGLAVGDTVLIGGK
jgi:RND family efflux transporter MFP subunit